MVGIEKSLAGSDTQAEAGSTDFEQVVSRVLPFANRRPQYKLSGKTTGLKHDKLVLKFEAPALPLEVDGRIIFARPGINQVERSGLRVDRQMTMEWFDADPDVDVKPYEVQVFGSDLDSVPYGLELYEQAAWGQTRAEAANRGFPPAFIERLPEPEAPAQGAVADRPGRLKTFLARLSLRRPS